MLVQDLGMKTGVFLAGKGIGEATDGIELLGDLQAVALVGALKDHMLDKMGNAVICGHLVPRTHVDPNTERNGAVVFQPF